MELRLELVAVVGANSVDSKGEFFDHIIHKINRVFLGMFLVDF